MRQSLQARTWWTPVALCIAALALVFRGPPTAVAAAAAATALATVPVAIVSWRAGRITATFLATLTAFALTNAASAVVRTVAPHHPHVVVWSEATALLSTSIVVVAIAAVVRGRRAHHDWGLVADAVVVALGTWVLAWVVLVRPVLHDLEQDPWLVAVRSSFQPLGAVVVFLLVLVVFSDDRRTAAVRAVTGAVVVGLLGGLVGALHAAGHTAAHTSVPNGLAILAHGLLFVALTHPSIRTIATRQPAEHGPALSARVPVTITALVVPLIVLTATRPTDARDLVVRSVSVGIMSAIVTARVLQAARGNRVAQDELIRTAHTDLLTGLPNRGLLLQAMNDTLSESWKGRGHPTLFFIDLDRFKNINDSLGHAAGDRVLCAVADRLRSAAPDRATVARMSGDEFVVLDPSSPSLEHSMDLGRQLLASLRATIELGDGDVFVTASVGVARLEPQSHRDADVLLRRADTAMYQAKDAGRDRVALFDESMHERVAHRRTVESALFRALDRRELRLYYQPILAVTTGDVVGFEALMRWRQGDGTIVSPVEFIPIAEETGTIIPIGAWALGEALGQLRDWIGDGVCSATANVSVNVSPRQLADPSFPIMVQDALTSAGMSPQHLWLEVTEGIMITDPELALATLRRLRSIGVRIALDDFGTGYSSLSFLQKFPLERIKIDRAFVQGVADNANDRALVRTIIAMGTSLGLDMVAEGVETIQQLLVLNELGCDKAQGYLISHPLPPDAMRSTVSALERMGPWPGIGRRAERPLLTDVELTEAELATAALPF